MLSCDGLHKAYGGLAVTRDVSMNVPRGQRHGVIGPNGAGKTTLFNLLSGEVMPDRGAIRLDGDDITRLEPDRRARRGLARGFQRNSCFPQMTVRENLAVAVAVASGLTWSMVRPLSARRALTTRVDEAAEAVGVADVLGAVAATLAHGTQRQLEIGLALAGRPRVVMLDEPTAGMSPGETERICTLIAGLPRDLTLLIIEHDMDVMRRLVDEITVLDRGAVIARGTPDAIQASALVQMRYLGGLAG